MAMALSSRAQELAKPDPKFFFWEIIQKPWHPQDKPDGYVCLGLAENVLMHYILAEHIQRNISLVSNDFTYGDGKNHLRSTLARFLNRHFRPIVPVDAAHITPTNGCSSAIEHAAWAFGNPGDSFLLGRPFYGTFVPDVTLRMGTKLAQVEFGPETDPIGPGCVSKYEEKILEVQANGGRVAGLILAHPHNPLGRCYPRAVLIELMKLCQKHHIHFISDEIYALSTFANTVDSVEVYPFESALSIHTAGVIDPSLVHVIWGMSKDFGANGIRLGAFVSQHNAELHRALLPVSLYSSTSAITDCAAANMLNDDEWVDKYIEENRSALQSNFEHVAKWAKGHGFEYAPGVNAAFFLWLNLGAAYRESHPELEENGGVDIDQLVMDALLGEKVFLASGTQFGSESPGWFRIVFSQKRDYLDEGLQRIVAAIQKRD
jgi:aspartate/methionine/tyrosine aminotransferase